jgi:glycosyltransferase involved in cell wall biosynthesis
MRLTYVIDSLAYGGAEHSLVALLPRLVDLGMDITVVCLFAREDDLADAAEAAGATVNFAPPTSILSQVRWLRKRLRADSPAVVHTTLWRSDLVGRLAAAGLEMPVVTSLVSAQDDAVRAAESGIPRWKLRITHLIERITGRWLTNHYHVVSDAVGENARERLGIAPERMTVVPRGRDSLTFKPPSEDARRDARSQFGILAGQQVVLHVGRQEPAKGLSYLIEAFALVVREAPHTILLLAGAPGSSTDDARTLVARLGLAEQVRFLGRRSDINRLLGAADVLVLPSIWEGLPNVVIEAMATGTAVVASDIQAVRNTVEPGGSALLAPPADPACLARQLLAILHNDDLRSRLGSRGRSIFLERFSVEQVADQMLALYTALSTRPAVGFRRNRTSQERT